MADNAIKNILEEQANISRQLAALSSQTAEITARQADVASRLADAWSDKPTTPVDPPPTGNIVRLGITATHADITRAFADLRKSGGTLMLAPSPKGHEYKVNLQRDEDSGAPIIITTDASNVSGLPTEGQRISREHLPALACISALAPADPVFRAGARSRNVTFRRIAVGPQLWTHTMIDLGDDARYLVRAEDRASDFAFDRVLFMGHPVNGQHRCIQPNCLRAAIIGCSFYDMFEHGRDSQAICGWNGTEAILIDNCYVEGGAENIMFGGAASAAWIGGGIWGGGGPPDPRMHPRNVRLTNSVLTKNPEWRKIEMIPSIKCLLELKNLIGFHMENCLLEKNWAGSWHSANAIMIKCSNEELEPTALVAEVTLRNIVVRDTGNPLTFVAEQDGGPTHPTRRMYGLNVSNFLAYRINMPDSIYKGSGTQLQFANLPIDSQIEHCTWHHPTNHTLAIQIWTDNGAKPAERLAYKNNVASGGSIGVHVSEEFGDVSFADRFQKAIPTGPDTTQGNVISGNAIRRGSDQSIKITGFNYIDQPAWDASFGPEHDILPGSAIAAIPTTDGKLPGADIAEIKAAMPWLTI
jgi:hypothetical protein